MITKGSPWKLKLKPKDGALHFDTNGNVLYAAEDENARWIALGMLCRLISDPGISE
jgi:hypothetical protein